MAHVYEGRTGLDILDRDECLALVRHQPVGRIAIVDGGHPLVFPVNYLLDGDDVVFRTGEGTKLDLAQRGPVCFEVDEIDPATRGGWSVMIHGRLEEVTAYDGPLFDRLAAAGVEPWAEAPKDHVMRVIARSITGRRIHRSR